LIEYLFLQQFTAKKWRHEDRGISDQSGIIFRKVSVSIVHKLAGLDFSMLDMVCSIHRHAYQETFIVQFIAKEAI